MCKLFIFFNGWDLWAQSERQTYIQTPGTNISSLAEVISLIGRLKSANMDSINGCLPHFKSFGTLSTDSRKKWEICGQICLLSPSALAILNILHLVKTVYICVCCIICSMLPFVWGIHLSLPLLLEHWRWRVDIKGSVARSPIGVLVDAEIVKSRVCWLASRRTSDP